MERHAEPIDAARSVLVLVDFQARLMPAIHRAETVVAEALRVADAARLLGIPVLGTEQNPAGLGPNDERIRQRCASTLAKMHFDACADGLLDALPQLAAPLDVVLAGCEAHVCLLQTALGVLRAGHRAFVVAPACGSRRASDHALAMQRLAQAGACLASPEMVVFEWLHHCRHERFRPVLQLLKDAGPRERPATTDPDGDSMDYASFYRRSIDEPEAFWAEQAALIDWERPFERVLAEREPPFVDWFVGGRTNLCHNAVDRHLAARAQQDALVWVSSEVEAERVYSFAELHAEVQRMAAVLLALGVKQGDRVLIYMPMIPEAAFAMLACARIGAIHSVVFGGFASVSLASRIEDAEPALVVSADAGSRAGKVVAYKPLLDEALRLSRHQPAKVLLVDRGLAPMECVAGRDEDYAPLRERHLDAAVPCAWLDSTHPSYTIYTSGTTGRPKGVQRDTGGYAVALAASMKHIFGCNAGETYFSTSDIGWVVGHSYIVYGPLIAGMATIMYEGLPIRPDAGVWWSLVEKYKVTAMFSAPTAVRVLKKQDPAFLKKYDLSSLRALFLAGEPLDEPTAQWIADGLGRPIIDNYWQTESGWPILTIANGVAPQRSKFGSPGIPMYGYKVKLLDESSGEELTGAGEKGVVVIEGPLPPGFMQTVWRDDARYVDTYWKSVPGRSVYSTFDWGIRDADGYYFILGRTDDVINVAGHRLGTREIEESISSHPAVAEVAVVGVADALKGQVAMAFAVLKDPAAIADEGARLRLEGDIMKRVDEQLGAVARPARVRFVTLLPKTRSGKLLRRAIQAVCERRDPGDLTTIEDPLALQQIRDIVAG